MGTNDRIMSATLECMAKYGIKGTTTKYLAKVACVNETTIFKNFKRKDELIHETLNNEVNKIKFEIDEYFQSLSKLDKFGIHSLSSFITNIYSKYTNYFIIEVKEMSNEDLAYIQPTVFEYIEKSMENKIFDSIDSISRKESQSIAFIMNSVFLVLLLETVKDCTYKRPSTLSVNKKDIAEVLERLLKNNI